MSIPEKISVRYPAELLMPSFNLDTNSCQYYLVFNIINIFFMFVETIFVDKTVSKIMFKFNHNQQINVRLQISYCLSSIIMGCYPENFVWVIIYRVILTSFNTVLDPDEDLGFFVPPTDSVCRTIDPIYFDKLQNKLEED